MHFRSDLSAERLREVMEYDPDTGIFYRRRFRVRRPSGNLHYEGYLRIFVDGANYFAQRLAWLYVYGRWPEGDIDHIDGDRLNNRISNLRETEHWLNMHNRTAPRPKKDPTIPRGVQQRGNRWRAMIGVNNRRIVLGSFDSKEEAGRAYAEAAELYAGDFRPLKEPAPDWKTRALEAERELAKLRAQVEVTDLAMPSPKNGESNGA